VPKAQPSAETRKPPVGYAESWHSLLPGPLQHSHPTRVVAWVGIVRHTSVYKGNPLFDRWVPVPITSTPKGFLIALIKVIREPFGSELLNEGGAP
jgi:hypothetical protein